MRNNKSKSFSFNVAKTQANAVKPLKARDGVAVAGCTSAGGVLGEPRQRVEVGFRRFTDDGAYC